MNINTNLNGVVRVTLTSIHPIVEVLRHYLIKTWDIEIHECKNNDTGNRIFLDVTVNNYKFTLVNIYGPNIDSPEFFESVSTNIANFENASIIVGPWNFVIIGARFGVIEKGIIECLTCGRHKHPNVWKGI